MVALERRIRRVDVNYYFPVKIRSYDPVATRASENVSYTKTKVRFYSQPLIRMHVIL